MANTFVSINTVGKCVDAAEIILFPAERRAHSKTWKYRHARTFFKGVPNVLSVAKQGSKTAHPAITKPSTEISNGELDDMSDSEGM